MGVPRYMVATSLQAVIAQRLVRLVCESCIEAYSPTAQEQRFVEGGWSTGGAPRYKKGRGCTHCNGSGYRGRSGAYEMLEMTPRLVEAAAKEDASVFVRIAREEMAGHSFVHHAAELAASGRTTLSEVMRISQSEE
jgi:MSHA biogenesis protein MshE